MNPDFYVEQKKHYTKDYILYDCIYEKFHNGQI